MSVEASSPAVDHRLASLTAQEIQQAAAILRGEGRLGETGFHLKPEGFFASNPAVDVAPPAACAHDGHAPGALPREGPDGR